MYLDFSLWGCYYTYINKFKRTTQVIISHKEYILNTTLGTLTETRTGITYTGSTTVLRELIDNSVSYKKLMMEGLLKRK